MSDNKATIIIREMMRKYPINSTWRPSEFVRFYWNKYQSDYPSNNSLNGSVFELLLVISLLRENIGPVYVQAELAFVPNVILDIVLYNRKTPVTISAKTTLRERWKQADLEAMATKYVHREAKCYVLTLSESEVYARRKEDNSYMGINEFVLAHTSEYDNLIENLKKIKISESESVRIIQTDNKIYRKEMIEQIYQINL
ncbi:hypothetical protein [Kingella sp. (in: b-proteobacteria)]|uniref:hypothetical protein n=1 Tax=Kingella sp. (in: b-proteobacteria) TaxID=2020713 RepID=UPI0026DD1BAF|nr:hypothetical protein [Kingella sp. (in: b-proteobacteria)]MDO4657812.1 hypothetical protein [Kingella sp. (in: b-proteobacteria)]